MATYAYRCEVDGPVDVRRPIGTAPATVDCPACGGPSARMITAPMLGLANGRRMAVIDHAESTRSEPRVVSSIPATQRTRVRRPDPRTSKLPRP